MNLKSELESFKQKQKENQESHNILAQENKSLKKIYKNPYKFNEICL